MVIGKRHPDNFPASPLFHLIDVNRQPECEPCMHPRLHRLLPPCERIHENRWLRWLGPHLLHPRLWHFSRRGVAVGVGLGVFFGLLIPIAQIPFAADSAVLLRANVPVAIGSTLVTNPVTFAPIYVLAHQVGAMLLGEIDARAPDFSIQPEPAIASDAHGWRQAWDGNPCLGKTRCCWAWQAVCRGHRTVDLWPDHAGLARQDHAGLEATQTQNRECGLAA